MGKGIKIVDGGYRLFTLFWGFFLILFSALGDLTLVIGTEKVNLNK